LGTLWRTQSTNPPLKQQKSAKARQNKINANKSSNKMNRRRGIPANRSGPLGTQRQTSAAAAYSTGQSSYAPLIQSSYESSRIKHRELIGSVVGTVAYSTAGLGPFFLNPGLSATFPWLATQAQGWEQYKFNSLKFCYYTRTGSATPGSVQLIPDYDAADAAPISEQIASAYEDVREDVPWKDIECVLDPRAMHPDGPRKFVRTSPLAANLDIKTYDVGQMFIGTTDGTAVNWGKLWVDYDVTLSTPQIPPGGFGVQGFQIVQSVVPTTANLFPGGGALVNAASTPYFNVPVTGQVITCNQAGTYLVTLQINATTSVVNTTNPAIANGGVLQDFDDGPGAYGSGSVAMAHVFVAKNCVVGTTITFTDTIVAGLFSMLLVAPISANIN
jgi:hypothetical protein